MIYVIMNKSLALKNKIYLFFLLIISLFIFIYLFYFLINGERGIISYYKIKNENMNYKITVRSLDKQNRVLSDRIGRLRTNTVDLDFLDEKIREKTGFLRKDEILIKLDY
jgi:cell division protein FtsB